MFRKIRCLCEISSSHGGEYEVQICLLGCTRQYIPEDKSELRSVFIVISAETTSMSEDFVVPTFVN
jgi:hypothetical protein